MLDKIDINNLPEPWSTISDSADNSAASTAEFSDDLKEVTVWGFTIKKVFDGKEHSGNKDEEVIIPRPEHYTYNGMTADEICAAAEEAGKYIDFYYVSPMTFGRLDLPESVIFMYPCLATMPADIVRCYRNLHPDARQCDCVRATGLTRSQVSRYWHKED